MRLINRLLLVQLLRLARDFAADSAVQDGNYASGTAP